MTEIFAKETLAASVASVTNTLFELCSDVIKGWQNLLKEYMLTMVLCTSPWSKSSSDTFDADDGAVLSHTRFSDSFIPDFFSSLQNLYTFSIIAPASSLYLHTSLAILLSEVALHVHNTSKHVFFSANM